MAYLAHTAHAQLAALWAACVGWILISVALGLIQWRVWLLADRDVVSSGVAWVGLWRACFNSHTVVSPGFQAMHCKYIDPTEAFAPPEIVAGQVLMLLSVLVGICGNAGGLYSMRNVYFGVERGSVGFIATGALCLLAAVMSLVPLVWNLTSVVTNQTIQFPPDFKLPPAPAAQYVGSKTSSPEFQTICINVPLVTHSPFIRPRCLSCLGGGILPGLQITGAAHKRNAQAEGIQLR
uniref:Claudin 34 n=1 Tax=Salarias fasciatus TaxID=181472 RepID=A0A672INS0_SALFA